MQDLDVFITTWPVHNKRLEYLCRTLTGIADHLRSSTRRIVVTVSSESEVKGDWRGDDLRHLSEQFDFRLVWHSGIANLGSHLNSLFDRRTSDVWFYCQDDFELQRTLDLDRGIELLETDSSVAMIRYYTIYATFSGTHPWLTVNLPHEQSIWPYGDNPFLAHTRWTRTAGRYVEGGDCGAHETTMIDQIRRSGLRLMVPSEMGYINNRQEANYYFEHIGGSHLRGVSAFEEKR